MKIKKTLALILAVSALVSLLAVPASAANNEDTAYTFNFVNGNHYSTEPREKTNKTPVYVYCQSGPSQGTVYRVYGGMSDIPFWENVFSDCTSGAGDAIVAPGQKRLIHSHVNENGYRFAMLHGVGNYTKAASGVWSPDSVGSYPFAN